MIYFIQSSENGLIKIGYSHSPEQRLAKLQTANPMPLKMLMVIDGDKDFEAKLHRMFKDFRAEGEWFYPVKPIKEFIELNKGGEHIVSVPRKIFALDKSMIIKPPLFDLTSEQLSSSPPRKGIDKYCEYARLIGDEIKGDEKRLTILAAFIVRDINFLETRGIVTAKDLSDSLLSLSIRRYFDEIFLISSTYRKWIDNTNVAMLKQLKDNLESMGKSLDDFR